MNEEYLEKLKDFYTQKIFNSKMNCKDLSKWKKIYRKWRLSYIFMWKWW